VSRLRVGVAVAALAISAAAVPVVSTAVGGVANAAPSTLGPCTGDLTGTTFTLTAECTTTAQIDVPDTITTIAGGGFTITAEDPTGGNFNGAVLTNASAGQTMTIENLTIHGAGFAIDCAVSLYGILFNDASGSVSNVKISDITQHSGCGSGLGIRANGLTGARTVTITNTVVSGYNKAALVASGSMTMNVTGSTLGPPDNLPGIISQNGVQYSNTAPGSTAGAGGTISGSTIYGSGYGMASDASTAMLLYGADGVTVSHDTFTGAGTDKGISVTNDSTGIQISHNQIGRTSPDSPDSFGIGVSVDTGSSAMLVCNTFSGWTTDIVGAAQAVCVTTTSLPDGTACHAYPSTTLAATSGTPPYTWTVASAGTLPPGLTLSSSGMISGTPTNAGTFAFTVQVTDSSSPHMTATQALTITVAPGCAIPTTTTTTSTTAPETTTPTAPVAPITASTLPVTG
jgi:hypothetical protein